jgi:hypothetical protein
MLRRSSERTIAAKPPLMGQQLHAKPSFCSNLRYFPVSAALYQYQHVPGESYTTRSQSMGGSALNRDEKKKTEIPNFKRCCFASPVACGFESACAFGEAGDGMHHN